MQSFQPDDTICNRYKVLRKLGAGAMGSVYLCEDSVEKNIKVALKVLISEQLEDQDVWAKGEYEALTRLRHPNLAKVYNFGRIGESNDYFIVSEFIKGIDLFSATEYLRYDELADIIVQICRALEYIHSQGYVHFDIKPDNILVTRYKTIGIKEGSKVQYNESDFSPSMQEAHAKPHVKLIDFGLAEKITGSFSFAIKGTLNYLAPEIVDGRTPDKRADLYSLGVTLYQVANRDLPFYQDAFSETPREQLKRSEIFEMHMKKHPGYLQDLILKLLEENVEDRFQAAKDVIHFINKHSSYHFDVETAETRASYFYSSKLVGRRREINRLKEYHERVFFPGRRRTDDGGAAEDSPGAGGPEDPAETVESEVRDAEIAAERSTQTGNPLGILITGEMGSGKSRLLEEFQHYLKLQDFTHFSGNCYEGNRKAYQPFLEVLRQLVYSVGFDSNLYRKHRQVILKLLPEMRQKTDLEDDDRQGARLDKEKLRFIDTLSQLLLEASEEIPYILVINNLHWIDEASLDLLETVFLRGDEMRKAGSPPRFLVLLSNRPEEPISDRLREVIEKWKATGPCHEIQVRRLKFSQVQEFLRSMLNFSDVPEGFVTKLIERTGGNPLFIVETLKTLEDDGIIRNSGGSWSIKTTNFDRIDIPQSMEEILGKRLEKLDPTKRELLETLSVLDKPVNPRFMQRLPRFEDKPILVELRDLEQSGIVMKSFEGGKLHFQIAQPKVREIVYAKIPNDKRDRYHGEVGNLFLEIYRGREEEILEELAYHYQKSDLHSRAIEMAIKAGDRLKRIYANERAYDHYMYVLDKVEGDPEFFDLWLSTREKVGDLCSIMGRYDTADASYACLLDEEILPRLDPERVTRIFLARGKVFEIQGDYDFALHCYKDARNYLAKRNGKKDLSIERIRVFNSIGWVYVCMGKYEKAMAISLEALRLIEGVPERIEHAMVYNTIGSANYFKGNFTEAIQYHRRSLQIKENLENMPETTTSLNNLGSAHLAGAEYGEAAEHLQRALKTSEEMGDPYGKAMSLHHFARLYFAVGMPEKGWECLDGSLKLSKLHNMRYLNIQNYIVRGRALTDQAEFNKAEGNFFRALTAFSKQANRWGLCTVLLQFAALHRRSGNLEDAASMVTEARRYAGELGIHSLQAGGLLEEARLLLQRDEGDVAEVLNLLEDSVALAQRSRHPELLAEVHFELGEALVRVRRVEEARKHFETTREKYREVIDNLPAEFKKTYRARLGRRMGDGGSEVEAAAPEPASPTIEQHPAEPQPEFPAEPATVCATNRAEESLDRVNGLMSFLLSAESLRSFLAKMLEDILAIVGGDSAFFLFVQSDSLTVEAARVSGGEPEKDPEELICVPLIENVLAGRKPLLLADTADDPKVAKLLEDGGISLRSLVVATFSIGVERRGVIYVINPDLPEGGGDSSFRLLTPFLNLAPIAYHQLSPEAAVEPQ